MQNVSVVFLDPLRWCGLLTGHKRETRRLVVAISLSGSAVNFSLTARRKEKQNYYITSSNITCSDCDRHSRKLILKINIVSCGPAVLRKTLYFTLQKKKKNSQLKLSAVQNKIKYKKQTGFLFLFKSKCLFQISYRSTSVRKKKSIKIRSPKK